MALNSIGMMLGTGMTVGTFFTLFIVSVFYSLIAAQHQPDQPAVASQDAKDGKLMPARAEA